MDHMISRHEPLAQQVRDYIHDQIITGTFPASSTYSVSEMSLRLGVSRTPVREAVLQLEEMGLVTIIRNKGFQVIEVSAEEIASAFQLRYLLEPFCAAWAAAGSGVEQLHQTMESSISEMREAGRRNDRPSFMAADRRFHDLILDQSGNRRLARAVNAARDATYTRGLSTHSAARTWDEICEEHTIILRAIEARDATAAETAMQDHIRATGEHLLRRMGYAPKPDWVGFLRS